MNNQILIRCLAAIAITVLIVIGLIVWRDGMQSAPFNNGPAFETSHLSIERADGEYFSYKVEVATTTDQQMYGLMFRHTLAPDTGMIFIYKPDQAVSMWMKNTYIPLDMLYVRKDGTIAKIITNAEPLNLTPLSSDEPVRAVIEINGGEAQKHGFKVGDKVLFFAFVPETGK